LGFTSGGLIVGSISGQFIAFSNYLRLFIRDYKRLFKYFSWARLTMLAKKYSDYPKFNFPHRLVDMISITGLPLIITYFFSEAILGWYGFMLRVLKAPLGILAASLGQVYFQQLSENIANKKSVISLFRKTVLRITLIILPFFLLILFWGPDIFSFVFGEKWRQAGVYAQYLTPWLFVSSITSPVSQTPLSLGYVKLNMIAGIFSNLLIVVTFIIFTKIFDNIEFIFLIIGIVMSVFFTLLLVWYNFIITKYENSEYKINN
jgi:O-antigen/teichoic acid export membrane protein